MTAGQGEIANPAHPPSGCHFHPRCKFAQQICAEQVPPLKQVRANHFAACHFAEELTLQGVAEAGVPND